eukprot:scaffold38128_cov50-Cyclotella_meneghiniana.AAC.1
MQTPPFDLILGVKILKKLGIILNFRDDKIQIDYISLPMRDILKLQSDAEIRKAWAVNNSQLRNEPKSTAELTERAIKILDANYEKADLPQVVKDNCKHLSKDQQSQLLNLLTEFEDLFDGTLSTWNTEPVSFELKEGATPYH